MPDLGLAKSLLIVADADLMAARVLADANVIPYQLIAFHCQQAVEKYLKAVLAFNDCLPPKMHDMGRLLELMDEHAIPYPDELNDLEYLTTYAVEHRYLFKVSDLMTFDSQSTLETIEQISSWAKKSINPCA